jgi:MipA family protein
MIRLIALCSLPFLLATAQAQSSEANKPIWELGLGLGALAAPDYRGSDQRSVYAVPLPYIIYRGETVKVDRDGFRASLFNATGVEVDMSAAGSFPVNSEKNKARAGMPNLGGSLEIGPSINVNLLKKGDTSIDLRMPLRGVITAGKGQGVRDNGVVFTPRINIDIKNVAGWDVGSYVGVLFANARHHQTYYSVSPQYATAARPAYEASGGYAGAQWVGGFSRRFDKIWVGAFARADSLKGATFEDSPLVKQKTAVYAGLAFAYVFYESAERTK